MKVETSCKSVEVKYNDMETEIEYFCDFMSLDDDRLYICKKGQISHVIYTKYIVSIFIRRV